MLCYLVSLRHTSVADSALTLWRHESRGYCWRQDWAGVYETDDPEVMKHASDENVFVPKIQADELFRNTFYDEEQMKCLPNTFIVQKALDLDPNKMKSPKYRTCHMSF